MNYEKVYQQLVDHAKSRKLSRKDCYIEQHHIIPHSEGGTNDKSNLVNLTAREHYIAHLLLAKIYDDALMHAAVTFMQTNRHKNRTFKFNSHLYAKMRIAFGNKIRGRHHTEETKKKISAACKGRPSPLKGKLAWNHGVRHSEATKLKISHKTSLSSKGRHWYNNGKKDIFAKECPTGFVGGRLSSTGKANGMFGHKHSNESRKKISNALKGKRFSQKRIEAIRIERTGKHWFTNGKRNRFRHTCPKGFWLGRTLKK